MRKKDGTLQSSDESLEEGYPLETMKLPNLSVGFYLAVALLAVEISLLEPGRENTFRTYWDIIYWAGLIYWFYCAYRFNLFLSRILPDDNPAGPKETALMGPTQFFSVFWILRSFNRLSKELTTRCDIKILNKYLIGGLILISTVFALFIDSVLGLAGLYGVLAYMKRKIKYAVRVFPARRPPETAPEA